MLVCEIPIIAMKFRRAGVLAHLPNLTRRHWKRSLRTKRIPTKMQQGFRNKWRMARRSSIQKIPVQHWALFSTQSTTNLNLSVLMRQSGCWLSILFANQQMTMFQATSIQFQTCLELSFWRTRFGPSGSLRGDGFWMLICQEHWWRMKWVVERLSPWLQRQCFVNWWLRKLQWVSHCLLYGWLPLKGGQFWQTTTFPALSVKCGHGICFRDWILCPATCWRSRQHRLTDIPHLYQPMSQSWW